MSWWERNPSLFNCEIEELSRNNNYRQTAYAVNKTLISGGNIIVRTEKINKFAVLIIYPEGFPYTPPVVHLLTENLTETELIELSKQSMKQIKQIVWDRKKMFYHRHQGVDGSLCILEQDDLHSERAEIVGARATILRTRDWLHGVLKGKFPMDSREVELHAHFPRIALDLDFLLTDSFYHKELIEGRFYVQHSRFIDDRFYIGAGIVGKNKNGIELSKFEAIKQNPIFFQSVWDVIDLEIKSEKVVEPIQSGDLIEGKWWDIDVEPRPFEEINNLMLLVEQNLEGGSSVFIKAIGQELARAHEKIYIGFRFPGRHDDLEWLMLRLVKLPDTGALLLPTEEELKRQLYNYTVEAIITEKITEEYFHMRNKGRAERSTLKDKQITMYGVGALGSTITNLLAKAGVGSFRLIDKGVLHAHNVIRHECGLLYVGGSKTAATFTHTLKYNPFVSFDPIAYTGTPIDITRLSDGEWTKVASQDFLGISTIADDNVEALLNEQAMLNSHEVFYIRALRGGKAGRIFRVRPGVDACKECLALYYAEEHVDFINVMDDPELPVLTNECNNPVRPASAADLTIIASIATRLVLDSLQKKDEELYNHWVWTTEELPNANLENNIPFTLHKKFLPPHPHCRLCKKVPFKRVKITEETRQKVIKEIHESGGMETGGILIGFVTPNCELVVTDASLSGPNAVKKIDWFERDVEYCQKYLEEKTLQTNNQVQYIGEWHHHPTGTNRPSLRDLQSMYEIAIQPNYGTDCPLMLIVSSTHDFAFTLHPHNTKFVQIQSEIISQEKVEQLMKLTKG